MEDKKFNRLLQQVDRLTNYAGTDIELPYLVKLLERFQEEDIEDIQSVIDVIKVYMNKED